MHAIVHAADVQDRDGGALARLQDILIRGLETTHREAGVFQAWDLPLVADRTKG
jgi:hypothetical protein